MLEGHIEKRPSLNDLISAGRLPANYLAQAFPEDPANSVAPLAERIERVSLSQLLEHGNTPRGSPPAMMSAPPASVVTQPAQMVPPGQGVAGVPPFPLLKAGATTPA